MNGKTIAVINSADRKCYWLSRVLIEDDGRVFEIYRVSHHQHWRKASAQQAGKRWAKDNGAALLAPIFQRPTGLHLANLVEPITPLAPPLTRWVHEGVAHRLLDDNGRELASVCLHIASRRYFVTVPGQPQVVVDNIVTAKVKAAQLRGQG